MKILVTGSRDWTDEQPILEALIAEGVIQAQRDSVTVIHGAAKGADQIAHRVALDLGYTVRPYPAEWNKYRDAAGPLRNLEMLVREHANRDQPGIDVCLAFPLKNSRGTRHMMKFAALAGIRVVDLGR